MQSNENGLFSALAKFNLTLGRVDLEVTVTAYHNEDGGVSPRFAILDLATNQVVIMFDNLYEVELYACLYKGIERR